MFNSAALEIAIALSFVFLLLSLIVTSATELVASVSRLRARHLKEGIAKLLGDPKTQTDFFAHPLIKSLARSGTASYIPSRTFAATLLDVVAKAKATGPRTLEEVRTAIAAITDADLKRALTALLEEAEHDVRKFEEQIEVWFNNQMDRVTGWYKRNIQWISLIIAAVVTLAANADSVAITRQLSKDPVLRAAIVAEAEKAAKAAPDGDQVNTPFRKLEESVAKVDGLGLPLGWSWEKLPRRGDNALGAWVQIVLGWVLTTIAIPLGAPFWFDVLNKFINLRGAGKAPEEAPKSPRKEPRPFGPGETPEDQRARAQITAKP
jgi:hypothetical protein